MKLPKKKWILICLSSVTILPLSFSLIHYLITNNPGYFLAHLTELARRENYSIIEKLNLPEFQIKFNEGDIAHFEDLYKDYRQFQDSGEEWFEKVFLPHYQKNNKWRKTTLMYNKVEYNIKVKSHGQSPVNHKYGKYFSLKIKLLDNKKIHNTSEFRLIIYRRIAEDYDLLHCLLKGANMIYEKEKLVCLRINEWEPMLFYFEQDVNQAFLVNQGWANKIIIEHPEYGSLVYSGGDTAFFINKMSEFFQSNNAHFKHLNNYKFFNNAIINRSSYTIINFLDFEYITTFNALRLLMRGNAHGLIETNLKVCFDTSNQLFYPIFHRDFTWNRVSDNPHLQANSWDTDYNSDLFFSIDANDSIRQYTYQKMYQYIIGDQECKLKRKMDSIINFHESLYYSSKIKSILRLGKKECISSSFNFFKDFFENVNINVNYYKGNDNLIFEIAHHSKSFLGIENFSIKDMDVKKMDSIKLTLVWTVDGKFINEMTFNPDAQNNSSVSFTKSLNNFHLYNKLDINSEWLQSKYYLIVNMNASNENYNINFRFKNRTTENIIPKENIKIQLKERNYFDLKLIHASL